MASITIHNIDDRLYNLLQVESKQKGISLNKTIKQLIKEHFGLTKTQEDEFNKFLGVWSEAELEEFNEKTSDLNKIEPNEW